jgi:predicted transcriptional regulator YdeE
MLSSCGLLCEGCYAFGKDCPGCECIEGKPSWADEIGIGTCELYQCARDRGMTSCTSCAALPCRQFVELRDPSLSVESHLANVNKRVERLRAASETASLAVSIRTRDSFCVVGYALDTSSDRSRREIPGFWERFFESEGPEKLGHLADAEARRGTYGICTRFDCSSGRFSYVIGVEAKAEADVPEEMVKITVPAALYVVAEVPLEIPAIHRAWDYLLKVWMPAAGYSHSGSEDFEFYPEECGCEVWVPFK